MGWWPFLAWFLTQDRTRSCWLWAQRAIAVFLTSQCSLQSLYSLSSSPGISVQTEEGRKKCETLGCPERGQRGPCSLTEHSSPCCLRHSLSAGCLFASLSPAAGGLLSCPQPGVMVSEDEASRNGAWAALSQPVFIPMSIGKGGKGKYGQKA